MEDDGVRMETLSDKIFQWENMRYSEGIKTEDVKEFIRKLKEQVKKSVYGYEKVGHNFRDMIVKLAGDKLI